MAKNYGKSELQTAAAAIAHEVKRPQAVQVFSELLNFDRAPKGDIKTDFKTALYVCAATKHGRIEDFVSNGNLIMLGFSLSSVGFEGPTQDFTVQDYIDTLQELIDEGALELRAWLAALLHNSHPTSPLANYVSPMRAAFTHSLVSLW